MWAQRESARGSTIIPYRSDDRTGWWRQYVPFSRRVRNDRSNANHPSKIIVPAHVSSRCAQSRALDTEPIFHGAIDEKSRSPGLRGVDRAMMRSDDSRAFGTLADKQPGCGDSRWRPGSCTCPPRQPSFTVQTRKLVETRMFPATIPSCVILSRTSMWFTSVANDSVIRLRSIKRSTALECDWQREQHACVHLCLSCGYCDRACRMPLGARRRLTW